MSRSDFGISKKKKFRPDFDVAKIGYEGPVLYRLCGYDVKRISQYEWREDNEYKDKINS